MTQTSIVPGTPRGLASNTQHTIAMPQVWQILQGVRDAGGDVQAIVQRAGISPSLLGSPLSRVTQSQFAALTFVLRRMTRDELWGLCRQPLRVGSFVQGCHLLIHCQTLGEALRAGCQFYHLLLHDFVPRLTVSQGVATYRLVRKVERDGRLSYAERVFSFFSYGLLCWLVARRIPLLKLVYPRDEVNSVTNAGVLFGIPIHYEGDSVLFTFEARWLDLPVVQNKQSLTEFLQQAPASLLVRYRDQTSLGERIRRLLRRHLAHDLPSIEDMGKALALTPQTLRRRLADEGTGYQTIKDELRRDAAIECLAHPELTLVDIANRLGYAEASTFHRAFKGWTGLSPGAYRQKLQR